MSADLWGKGSGSLDWVGEDSRPPLPPNRACSSPAHGSPEGSYPHRDWLA